MEQIKPVPFEDWTPAAFVPFSPRHGPVQPESDLSLQFPNSIASRRAENFHPDVVGQFRLQHFDDGLESLENAIDMEVQELLSRCFPAGFTGNTCSSCNTHNSDGSSEDNVSSDGCMSNSELDSETESSPDTDFHTLCLQSGTDKVTASKQISHCNQDSSCNQMNSTDKRSVVEDWLADSHTNNRNNAGVSKKRKEKHDVSARSSVDGSKPCAKMPTKCDDNFCEQEHFGQSDLNDDYCTDNQSVCSQSSGVQVKKQSKVLLQKKNKKKVSISKSAVASRTENWQVINISERCSLFDYKQEILRQQTPVHHVNFSRQVRLLSV